jgi:hypothetical protein
VAAVNELEERIRGLLSDPAQMERLTGLAQRLMGGADTPQAAPPSGAPDAGLLAKLAAGLQGAESTAGRERALLAAMRPYLSEGRREKMDRAVKLARMAKLAQRVMGEMGGGHDAL